MVSRMPPPDSTPDLTVHDWGGPPDAPALFLMHGLTDSGECWADAVPRWTPRFRVLSWDARGHGTSPRFTPEQLDRGVGETMADDAVAVLEWLARQDITRPLLVGHSMGGGTAGSSPAAARTSSARSSSRTLPWGRTRPRRRPTASAPALTVSRTPLWEDDPAGAEAKGRAENPDWPEAEYAAWARSKRQTDTAMLATGRPGDADLLEVAAEVAVPALLLTCDDPLLWDDEGRAALVGLGNPLLQVERVAGAGPASVAAAPRSSTGSSTRTSRRTVAASTARASTARWRRLGSTHMRSPLATRELGRTSGPVLVLLHANGDSAASWPDAARRWGDRYRVVAVDARGPRRLPVVQPRPVEEPGDVFIADAIELLEEIAGTAIRSSASATRSGRAP